VEEASNIKLYFSHLLGRGPLPQPSGPGRLGPIDAAQQSGKSFRRNFERLPGVAGWGPPERSGLKSLGAHPKTRSVPVEKLDHVAPPVGEAEKMAAVRKLAQMALLNAAAQPVETLAHIGNSAKEIDVSVGADREHLSSAEEIQRISMSRSRVASSNPGQTLQVTPLGK